jgi:hypothetical protein
VAPALPEEKQKASPPASGSPDLRHAVASR